MEKDQVEGNWSETVEDLVATGEIESAISFLESVVSKLEALNTSESGPELQLASVLTDLAKLYSSSGFSLKADELESRAFVIGQKARQYYNAALDAQNSIRCPFTMRNLDEDDKLLSSIKTKRPGVSSARATNISSSSPKIDYSWYGVKIDIHNLWVPRVEIVTRQKLRDEAWGDDLN